MEKKIMIVSEAQSYLAIGLKDKFVEAGFAVNFVKPDISAVSKEIQKMDAIILYCDDRLVEQVSALNFLKDAVLEHDLLLFAVGNTEELDNMFKIVPREVCRKTFLRPINVPEVITCISELIENYGKNGKKRILVVDDSGAMLRNVKAWLEGKYQVVLANSGAMAIKYLAINQPDLILLDYEMPVVDGKQVLQMIRAEADFAHIPVIFLTSKGDKESVVNVMSLKPEGYLLKTLSPQEIIQSVDEFFEKQKGHSIGMH